jgi:hypothetical protein
MYCSEILKTSSTVPVTLIRMAMVAVVMRHGTAVSTQTVENGLRIMAVTDVVLYQCRRIEDFEKLVVREKASR